MSANTQNKQSKSSKRRNRRLKKKKENTNTLFEVDSNENVEAKNDIESYGLMLRGFIDFKWQLLKPARILTFSL